MAAVAVDKVITVRSRATVLLGSGARALMTAELGKGTVTILSSMGGNTGTLSVGRSSMFTSV